MDSPSSVQRSHRKQAAATEFLSFDFVSTVPQSEYWNTLGKFHVPSVGHAEGTRKQQLL